jgi:hypothetical protein
VTIKTIIITISAIVVVILAAVGLFIQQEYYSDSVRFQEYAPETLPPGTSITVKSIDIWTSPRTLSLSWFTTKQLILTLNHAYSSIAEQKNINFDYTCGEYAEIAANETCTVAETPNHQRYQLVMSYDNQSLDKPFFETVSWLRGDTYIWLTLQGNPVTIYSADTWSKVIDSFTPVHYSHLAVFRTAPGP